MQMFYEIFYHIVPNGHGCMRFLSRISGCVEYNAYICVFYIM